MPTDSQPKKAVLQENALILEILSTVERDNRTTQRKLSRELDIALGLANAYVKRCVKKGYIKIRQVPLNRYAYYLTPKGFGEKSRLTAEYLTVSFNFFRDARAQCATLFERCTANGLHTLALAGDLDLRSGPCRTTVTVRFPTERIVPSPRDTKFKDKSPRKAG